jgi:protoheme IX farnesyltransferase
MKAAVLPLVEVRPPADGLAAPCAPADRRVADYLQLVRPRVAVMVLVTVALGGWLAAPGVVPPAALWHAVLGVALVTAGASALNQYLERHTDRRMHRTRHRPLPDGRLGAWEVLALGWAVTVAGLVYLAVTVPTPAAALVTAVTFALYVFAYTPAKRATTLNTLIGAVPGALPPVIGWAAVTGGVEAGAVALFLLVFVWQVPHFLAIAWMYRDDYARAGLKMLPVNDPAGDDTARQMLLYGLTLVPVSLWPVPLGLAGGAGYALGAVALAGAFLRPILRFRRERTVEAARAVLKASLAYLPGVLALLVAAKYWLPG